MAGKEIDRERARSAFEVAKQHPGMVLFAVSPVLLAVILVWYLATPGWAILLLLAALGVGAAALLVKR